MAVVVLQSLPKSPSHYTLLLCPQQEPPLKTSWPSLSLSSSLRKLECSCIFSQTHKSQLKPRSTQLFFPSGKRVFIQCSRVNSPSSSDTDTGMLFSFLGEFGLDEKESEVLLSKNSSLSSSSLDSVRARMVSLQSVGIDGFELYLLITKRPNVLTSHEIDDFIRYVLDDLGGKIESPQLNRFFLSTNPMLMAGFDRKVDLLLKRGVPQEKIIHVLNHVNLSKSLCVKPIEQLDRTIDFLNRYGGIDLIVKRPSLLNYDLETHLIPRVGFFTKLSGGDKEAVGVVLGKLPAVLNYSLKHFEGHASFFRSSLGLTDEEIFKLVLVYPNVFSASRVRKLIPRIEFLKQCGLDSGEIYKFLTRAPLFLSLSFKDNITHKLVLLLKIGYRYRTKDLAVAVGSVTRTSCLNMHKVIGLFFSYGFLCSDILSMSKKHPPILQYSYGSLEEKMEYLIEEMGREIDELLAFPAFLGYKLNDRIKARYELRREICGGGMSINKLLSISTERFSREKANSSASDVVEKG